VRDFSRNPWRSPSVNAGKPVTPLRGHRLLEAMIMPNGPSIPVALRSDFGPPLTWRVHARVDFAVGSRISRPGYRRLGLSCDPGGEPDVIWASGPQVSMCERGAIDPTGFERFRSGGNRPPGWAVSGE
jgi:hypothetical protein